LQIRRTVVAHAVAALGQVARSGRAATGRRALLVRRTVGAVAVARLRDVTLTGGRTTRRAGVARQVLARERRPAEVGGAGVAVVGARVAGEEDVALVGAHGRNGEREQERGDQDGATHAAREYH